MIIVRPVKLSDFDQLYKLAGKAKAGLTTLPHDKEVLRSNIKESVKSFKTRKYKKGEKAFLFVMEDMDKRKVIGTSSIVSKIGGAQPFYTYQIKTKVKESSKLKIKKSIKYLKLLLVYDGPAEIGTLFLDPSYRKHGNGRLLSFSRFLFMAQYRKQFRSTVIAELRGVIDKNDKSPFWEALGKHFFMIEFKKADLMGLKDKSFIADLVPRHPIYIPLLPISAQKVIKQVHNNTKPALGLLEKQGFKKTDWIDIFEAGPVVKARIGDIKTVKDSKSVVVKDIVKDDIESASYIISNVDGFNKFKVVQGTLKRVNSRGVILSYEVARAINVKKGSKVRFAPLR